MLQSRLWEVDQAENAARIQPPFHGPNETLRNANGFCMGFVQVADIVGPVLCWMASDLSLRMRIDMGDSSFSSPPLLAASKMYFTLRAKGPSWSLLY